jgi:hypothetical protein
VVAVDNGLFVLAQQRLQLGVFDAVHVQDVAVRRIVLLALCLDLEEGLPEVRGYAVSHLDAIAELLYEVIQDASHAI